MALTSSFCPLPCFAKSIEIKTRLRVRARSSASSGDSIALSSDSLVVKEASFTKERVKNQVLDDVEKKEQERDGTVIGGANERLKPRVERKWMKDVVVSKDLEFLWDDGYRTKTIIDHLNGAAEMIKPDGGAS